MFDRVGALVIGYLWGCVLTAEIVARVITRRSVFDMGDGNPGMANVGHELGTKAALVCLSGDIVKTVAGAACARALFPQLGDLATAWAGLGATLGHDFPFWHGLHGGKGVTTIASTIILMFPVWGVTAGVVGVVTIVLSGYLCVGAIVAITFYTALMPIVATAEQTLVSLAFVMLSLHAHWSKLVGIRKGTTRRAGLSKRFWEIVRRNS